MTESTPFLESRFLTVAQAARNLNCRQETIRRYIHTGVLHAFKLPSGYFRIREEDLKRCLKRTEGYVGLEH